MCMQCFKKVQVQLKKINNLEKFLIFYLLSQEEKLLYYLDPSIFIIC